MNITPERVKELRVRAADGLKNAQEYHDIFLEGVVKDSWKARVDFWTDIIALLAAAQTEPTSGERQKMAAQIKHWADAADILSGLAKKIAPLAYGQPGGFSTEDIDILHEAEALILSGPAPRVVSREWVRQRATDLDNGCEYCGAESTGNPSEIGIASMLKELGIEVAEVVL